MRLFWAAGFGVVLGLCFLPHEAAAQEAKAAVATGSDIVRSKNGGLVRGTITELVPGQAVTIVTPAGKTIEFQMSEVDYAGPAAKDPAAQSSAPAEAAPQASSDKGEEKAEPYVTVESKRANVHFESDPPGLTFHRASGSAVAFGANGQVAALGYERLCTAPCSVKMPAGTEALSISKADSMPTRSVEVTIPPGNSTIRGSLESRSGLRAAGWVMVVVGLAAGAGLMVASIGHHDECTDTQAIPSLGLAANRSCVTITDTSVPLLLAGGLVAAGGISIGVVLATRRDLPKIDVASRQLPVAAPGLSLMSAF